MRPFILALVIASGLIASASAAELPFLHPLFTDGCVVQRGVKAPVWGWAAPGQAVTVEMFGAKATATADAGGRWLARIGPFPAGGPFAMTVTGAAAVTVKDVLVGDVWLCSGQSNMQMSVQGVENAAQEIAGADHPQIHLFTVPNVTSAVPQRLVDAHWQPCSPATVAGFSAVGYFFGRDLNRDLKVPIGLIHSSWGGTPAESWVGADALSAMPEFTAPVAEVRRFWSMDPAQRLAVRETWFAEKDPGTTKGWSKPETDSSTWRTGDMPKYIEDVPPPAGLPGFDGVIWFQKTVDIPAAWAGKELVLHLGTIDDMDTTWVNGVAVGATDGYSVQRDYPVPAAVVKAGAANVIAIRVLDTGGQGGMGGYANQLRIHPAGDEAAAIPLAGPWKFQDSAPISALQPLSPALGTGPGPNSPSVLSNAMIEPLLPYALTGAIWYQGESNHQRAWQYRTLLPTLIADWRARFGQPQLAFHIVSLANWMTRNDQPVDDTWAELREAQAVTAKTVPGCGIAMAVDVGDAVNIHPTNKQEVGRRLALSVRAITYGEKKLEWSGPWYAAMKIAAGSITLRFDHVGGGLVAKDGGKLIGFAIAGDDRKFVWADAALSGDTVVVTSPQVPKPVAVRYAWSANPACNLYNKDGLPAVPFRTDDWPAKSLDAK